MIKLARMTDYAIALATIMARQPEVLHTVVSLAEKTSLSQTTVAQVLKKLARGKVLSSVRGAHGGYCLALGAEALSMAHIIEIMEGEIALTRCLKLTKKQNSCALEGVCHKKSWQTVNNAVRGAFSAVSLQDLAKD